MHNTVQSNLPAPNCHNRRRSDCISHSLPSLSVLVMLTFIESLHSPFSPFHLTLIYPHLAVVFFLFIFSISILLALCGAYDIYITALFFFLFFSSAIHNALAPRAPNMLRPPPNTESFLPLSHLLPTYVSFCSLSYHFLTARSYFHPFPFCFPSCLPSPQNCPAHSLLAKAIPALLFIYIFPPPHLSRPLVRSRVVQGGIITALQTNTRNSASLAVSSDMS